MAGMLLTFDPGFASFGVATMTVVAVAMLGSLTVLPALLSKLGDNVDRLECRSSTGCAATTARAGSGARSSTASSGDRSCRSCWPAGFSSRSRCRRTSCSTAQPSIDTFPQNLLTTYNRLKEAFPGHRDRRERRRQGAERRGAGGAGGDRPAQVARDRQRRHERADRRRRQRGEDGREHHDPDRGRRHRLHVEPGAGGAPRRDHPADASARSPAPRSA